MAAEHRLLDRVQWSATIALAAMPVLGMRPMVLVIATWSIVSFASYLSRRGDVVWNWNRTLLLASPFLLMLVDAARAPDRWEAWRLAETSSALLLFPLGFALIGPSYTLLRSRMTEVFSWSALALALWANGGILLCAGAWPSAQDAALPFSHYYRQAFAHMTHVHAPYAAYWFFSAALFQIHRSLRSESARVWRVVFATALVVAGVIIGSRMPIIAFGMACCALIIFRSNTRKAFSWIPIVILALGVLALAIPGSRDRTMEAYRTFTSTTGAMGINSVSIRSPILHCGLQLLEDHWIFGLGQPAVQPALDACYKATGPIQLADGSHSSHAQPIHWWLSFGLPGLAAFVLLFGHSLRSAYLHRDGLHFAFVLFILLCCLTENVLARQWGVVLFACFNTLFVVGGSGTASELHTPDPLNNER